MEIKNNIVLITGGSSGLGKACAEACLASGARVFVLDRQPCTLKHVDLLYRSCDLSDLASVERVLKDLFEFQGVPRVLIQCAGVLGQGRMVGKNGLMPIDAFKKVIDINLIASFYIMQLVAAQMMSLPVLEEGEKGVVINTASIAAYEGQIGQMAYSASKAAVVGMTLPAARELASHGIRVNTIAPGLMDTPMLQGMTPELKAALEEKLIYPKRLGKPEEFACLCLHLVKNTLINGEVIRLDGGVRLSAR